MQHHPDALASLRRAVILELSADIVAALLVGSFAGDHASQMKFFVPAVGLGAYIIAIVIAMGRQLVMLGAVDYGEPVVRVQERLAKLRLLRIRTTLGILLFAPLMWLPLLIVAARGLFGADVYAAGAAWLTANTLFGLAVIPIAVWLAKRYGRRAQHSKVLHALADEIAGRSLGTALRDLQTLREFTAG